MIAKCFPAAVSEIQGGKYSLRHTVNLEMMDLVGLEDSSLPRQKPWGGSSFPRPGGAVGSGMAFQRLGGPHGEASSLGNVLTTKFRCRSPF